MKTIRFDTSSTLLFRFFFGMVLLFETCWTFCFNFNVLFDTEQGVWGSYFTEKYIANYSPSNPLFYLVTTNFQLQAYIGLILILLLLYITGYFPKLLSLLLTVLLGALYAKYNILLSGWPQYMLCVLFLSSFVIENNDSNKAAGRYWYEFVLLFQVGFIYFFNAVSKSGTYWLNGSAIEMSFRHYPLTTPFGNALLSFPFLLKMLTYGSLVFEVLLFILFVFFYSNKKVRLFSGLALILFHLGIQSTMQVGHFYLVVISIGLLIMPLDSFLPKKSVLPAFLSVKRYSPVLTGNRYVHGFAAGALLYCILISNLYQYQVQASRASNTDFSESVLSGFYPSNIQYVPFFNQYWHFFAPNPPLKAGVIAFVGIEQDTKKPLLIYGGQQINTVNYTGLSQYLSVYMALKDYNVKDRLFIESSLRRQFLLWNANPSNPRLSSFNLFEFYGVRYMDHLPVDSLMKESTSKKLKLNFELKYK